MQRHNQWLMCALAVAGLQLAACQQKPEAQTQIDPTKVEFTGEALYRVRLTAKRAEEIGIITAPLREENIAGSLRRVVSAAAVVHDPQGNAWIFKNPNPLVFVRERISVDRIEGGLAILSDGPPVGTAVVTAGAAQLFSDEFSETREGTIASQTTAGGPENKNTGIATMKEDGTIRVVYKTEGRTGFGASIVIEYKPTDEEYQKILDQVGGLQVGESKAVPPALIK
jgi:hypothetical protein